MTMMAKGIAEPVLIAALSFPVVLAVLLLPFQPNGAPCYAKSFLLDSRRTLPGNTLPLPID
jgi:hypothetical protein